MPQSYRHNRVRTLSAAGRTLWLAAALLVTAPAFATDWPVTRWQGDHPAPGALQLNNADPPPHLHPLPHPTSQPWRLCAVYPHLKDSYWHAVNFGMVEEARRLGVGLQVVEAGGYEHPARQRALVEACLNDVSIDALLLGTVTFDGFNDLLQPVLATRPVLALVNDIDAGSVRAKVGVPWYQLGWKIGNWLARRHPAGTRTVHIAWFPGPLEAGWVGFIDRGFRAALQDSAVHIATVHWGDTGRSVQRQLVEDALDASPALDYLVGNAPMAEVAVAELRRRGREADTGIVASYITPGVYGALVRGRILASVTDFPVLQGRIALQQAVRVLEGQPVEAHIGPSVELIEPATLNHYPADWMMAPAGFAPVYEVKPAQAPQGDRAGAKMKASDRN